jgi:hypothetical protein
MLLDIGISHVKLSSNHIIVSHFFFGYLVGCPLLSFRQYYKLKKKKWFPFSVGRLGTQRLVNFSLFSDPYGITTLPYHVVKPRSFQIRM